MVSSEDDVLASLSISRDNERARPKLSVSLLKWGVRSEDDDHDADHDDGGGGGG